MSEFNWDNIINKDSGEKSPPVPKEEARQEKEELLNAETLEALNKTVSETKKKLRSAVLEVKKDVMKIRFERAKKWLSDNRMRITATTITIGFLALVTYIAMHFPDSFKSEEPEVKQEPVKQEPTPEVRNTTPTQPKEEPKQEVKEPVKQEPKPEVPQAKAAVEVAKPPPQKPRPKAAHQEAKPKQEQDNWNKREANKQLDDFFTN